MSKPFLYLDICGTLFYQNTTFGFVHFVIVDFPLRFFLFSIANRHISPFTFLLKVIDRLFNLNLQRNLNLFLLRSLPRDYLLSKASSYVDYLFSSSLNHHVFSLLKHYSSSHDLFIASASLDIVVNEIALRLSCGSISSKLSFNDEFLCNGYVTSDTLRSKYSLLTNLFGNKVISSSVVITDNLTDLALVKSASISYIPVYSKSARQFWLRNSPLSFLI